MKWNRIVQLNCLIILLNAITINVYADTINNPCAGDSPLLNIIDRPTIGDSACVVPYKHAVLEAGYQYQHLTQGAGHAQNFPEAEFRLGLPANNELAIVLPNYIHQSMTPHSGFTATTAGIKHEIGYNEHWVTSVEGLFTLPSGSSAFGSDKLGFAFNGIASYNINSKLNLSFMLGVTTETQPHSAGGQRFNSINPDVVFTYAPTDKLNFYAEVYGQSKTGPGEGSGFNANGGFLYLILSNVEIDMEVGQRISGNLVGFEHTIGAGLGILF